jgi:O-antigen/teichoic acid export membrane protein
MHKRRILINGLASVLQVVVTGGSFLVLYRFVKDMVGIAQFGVWALVVATVSTSVIGDLGISTSAVKFVSMYLSRGQESRVVQVVQTVVISLGASLGLVLIALYPLLVRILEAVVEPELFPVALSLLPYALAAFWVSAVAGVLHGCVDGCQRVDLRSGLLSSAALVYLGLVVVLVPRRGLVGLAQAQVLQAGLLLLASWLLLKRLVRALPLVPYRWDRATFKEMLGYTVSCQAISASKLLFDPLTKILVTRFGGAAATGYFEFAHRMVFQLRALIVTAHRAIVPAIADLHERNPALLQEIYRKSSRLLLYWIVLCLPFCIAVTPLISRLWIGVHEPVFVLFADLVCAGWFLNTIANPAYFAYLGIGRLQWNVAGHVVIGILNAGLGFVLGRLYGAAGVVTGFVIALIAGSLVIAVAYQREYRIRFVDLIERASVVLSVAGLAGLALASSLYHRLADSLPLGWLIVLVPGAFFAVVIGPLWMHPVRRQLQGWLRSLASRGSCATQVAEGR